MTSVRYFFHYRDENDSLCEDRVGSVHPDLDSAELQARELALEYLEEAIDAGGSPAAPRTIEITDEEGREVLYLPFWAGLTLIGSNSGPESRRLH